VQSRAVELFCILVVIVTGPVMALVYQTFDLARDIVADIAEFVAALFGEVGEWCRLVRKFLRLLVVRRW
jgi:hypothetical protein